VDSEKQLPITINFEHYQEYWDQEDVYKVGFKIGIQ